MIVTLEIYGVICLVGVVFFTWAIHKAPVIEEYENDEDWLLANDPDYLGQGRYK